MAQANHQPIFSIIMPVYNHARYVGQAIESVLAQTFDDWELLVVDDGSTDNSGRMLDEFAARDNRIIALHQINSGPSTARNKGIQSARGLWLAYLDSDDLWYPTALETYRKYLAEHPQVQFVHGFRDRLRDNGQIEKGQGEFQDRPTGAVELFGRMYLSHLCVCYRRELALKVGGYDPNLRTGEDYDLYLRMSPLTPFWPLGQSTGLRRRHDSNISRRTGRSRLTEALMLERYFHQLGGDKTIPHDLATQRLARVFHSAAKLFMREKQFILSAEAANRSHQYRPKLATWSIDRVAGILSPFTRQPQPPVLLPPFQPGL